MNKPFIDHEVTMEQIEKRLKKTKIVLYGAQSCWWATSWVEVYKHPINQLPCDPLGGMLMQTDDGNIQSAMQFIESAKSNPGHYGKHGIRAFLLAHHGCVQVISPRTGNKVPTCFGTWGEYNELIDEMENRK